MSTEGARQSSGSGPVITVNAPTKTAPWVGRLVKRFKLLDELGQGAMGRVFVAEDTVIRRHVALKLLPIKHKDGRINNRSQRLVREARSAAVLEHPNVVTIYEIDEAGGVHYIAMELVEGGNLERLVQLSGPMEVERACLLGAEAAEALAHAHQRGIIHRDVKPANLLLTRSGRCKVADFGLAVFDDVTDSVQRSRCAGSPHFIAPEVAQGKGATELSDIYSLGCTLWYLLSGRPPFTASSSRDVLKLHITEPLPDLRRWRPDVPPRLLEAIAQACHKDPRQRFQDADRFAKILRTFTIPTGSFASASAAAMAPVTAFQPAAPLAGSMIAAPVHVIAPSPAPSAADPRLPQPMIWAGLVALATAVLIALGVWLARSQPTSPRDTMPLLAAAPPASIKTPAPTAVAAPPAKPTAATIASKISVNASSVVKNGGLEETDGDGKLVAWTIPDRFRSAIQLINESGNKFLRVTNSDSTKNVFAEQELELDPSWKSLTISLRIRASALEPGAQMPHDARLAVTFHDGKGKRIGGWPIVPNLTKTSAWVARKVQLQIPPGAVTVLLQPAIFCAAGTVDYDDIKVVPQ